MRRMPIRYNKNADIAKKIQQKELETEKENNKENDKKRIESMSTNQNSVLGRVVAVGKETFGGKGNFAYAWRNSPEL